MDGRDRNGRREFLRLTGSAAAVLAAAPWLTSCLSPTPVPPPTDPSDGYGPLEPADANGGDASRARPSRERVEHRLQPLPVAGQDVLDVRRPLVTKLAAQDAGPTGAGSPRTREP